MRRAAMRRPLRLLVVLGAGAGFALLAARRGDGALGRLAEPLPSADRWPPVPPPRHPPGPVEHPA